MKFREKVLLARTNDELELPILTALTCIELAKKLNRSKACLCHCIIDKMLCNGLSVDVVNLENDYKPNTFEDYIEFCKFEKISPCRYTSLCQYRQSLEREKEIEQSFSI